MSVREAITILDHIDGDNFSDAEKAIAIYKIMNLPTYNSIPKRVIIKAIKWLWNKHYFFEKCSEVIDND